MVVTLILFMALILFMVIDYNGGRIYEHILAKVDLRNLYSNSGSESEKSPAWMGMGVQFWATRKERTLTNSTSPQQVSNSKYYLAAPFAARSPQSTTVFLQERSCHSISY